MSPLNPQKTLPPNVSEDAIATYLGDNPDFFERHAGLLAAMQLSHDGGEPRSRWWNGK